MKEFWNIYGQRKDSRKPPGWPIEDGSWAPAARAADARKLEEMKDIHLYETVVSLRGALNQTSEPQMDIWWLSSAQEISYNKPQLFFVRRSDGLTHLLYVPRAEYRHLRLKVTMWCGARPES